MKRLFDRVSGLAWLSVVALLGIVLLHCVSDAGNENAIVVSDGGVVVEESSVVMATLYSASGTVDGLPPNATVTLTLNGANAIQAPDGPFSFPALLLQGQGYAIVAGSTVAGYACSVAKGAGTVGAADVTGVVVHCGSSDATLSALAISAAPITPSFVPDTLSYTAGPIRIEAALPPLTTTTVTATAADKGALITIAGAAATSGSPSAPITVKPGTSTIDVIVTAADGKTQKHYAVAVAGVPSDYVKASNTLSTQYFGWAVALSGDGNTMAIGGYSEQSAATGINGSQTDTSANVAGAVYVFTRTGATWTQQAYIKASNTRAGARFGYAVALSTDGNTLAVGSPGESSAATGVNGNQADASAPSAGAVYVFTRSGTNWSQQAYVKASNARNGSQFGFSVALAGDGNTLAVGAYAESSNGTGIDGDQADTSATDAGSAYVFTRAGTTWTQQAYVKASNTRANAYFGYFVALSDDGSTLAVGSPYENSNATGIGGNQADTSATHAGAVYVFTRSGTTWSQQEYVKPSNTKVGMSSEFGWSVALSSDGNTLAVGAYGEYSKSTGVNGDQTDQSVPNAGAVYVFTRAITTWSQQAYVKASNTRGGALFGFSVALSGDGNTLAVGARAETSNATAIDGNQADSSTAGAGAAYVFARTGTTWSQTRYVKASNTRPNAAFGWGLALARSGAALAVGAPEETSAATGINGNQSDTSLANAGAVYVY